MFHLNSQVTQPSLLPTYICTGCLDKVSEFHAYCQEILATQQHFVDNLVKQEPMDSAGDFSDAIALPLPSMADSGQLEATFIETHEEQLTENGRIQSDSESIADDMFDDSVDEFIDEPIIKEERFDRLEQMEFEQVNNLAAINAVDDWLFEHENQGFNNDNLPDDETIAAVIAKYFKPTCHLCPIKLPTFDEAKVHYLSRHNIKKGFLRCCGIKLTNRIFVIDHVRWHLDPMTFW